MDVEVKNFCCGCTVRVGCIVMGFVYLVLGVVTAFTEGLIILGYDYTPSDVKNLYLVNGFWAFLSALASIVLIVASFVGSRVILRVCLWFEVISLHVRCILSLAGTLIELPNGDPAFPAGITAFQLFRAALLVYVMLLVNSYANQIKREEENAEETTQNEDETEETTQNADESEETTQSEHRSS